MSSTGTFAAYALLTDGATVRVSDRGLTYSDAQLVIGRVMRAKARASENHPYYAVIGGERALFIRSDADPRYKGMPRDHRWAQYASAPKRRRTLVATHPETGAAAEITTQGTYTLAAVATLRDGGGATILAKGNSEASVRSRGLTLYRDWRHCTGLIHVVPLVAKESK